jgi:hypothetical protein
MQALSDSNDRGLEVPQESLRKGVTREQVVEGLRRDPVRRGGGAAERRTDFGYGHAP